MEKIIIVLDCGATNVRAIAINEKGIIVAQESLSNSTQKDPKYNNYIIWDIEEIWRKLKSCTNKIIPKIDANNLVGITVTTFGVDGAPVDENGKIIFPIISWQCGRTAPIMENINKYISLEHLYKINGIQPAAFNTINKLVWLKENESEIFNKMENFMFISSLFLHKLTGNKVTESTMAGTSMLTNLESQKFSDEIFKTLGLKSDLFPKMVNSGDKVGEVILSASSDLGIPLGIPVFAAGHDTQFAIFGSGANLDEAVLSSGTWEILMARTSNISTETLTSESGVTIEFDSKISNYDIGCQWVASGVLEWVKNMFYADLRGQDDIYEVMIKDAETVTNSSVRFVDNFSFTGSQKGTITGLSMSTSRAEIYRASLEYLALKLKHNLDVLQSAANFKAKSVICVGGGSKNKLWNQLKADCLQIPIKTINQKETTVLGAALFAFVGAGLYKTPEEARNNISYETEIYYPKDMQ